MSSRARPAAGGGRWVEVAPERMAGWLDRFDSRHGGAQWQPTATGLCLVGADGDTADCRLPLGWPTVRPRPDRTLGGDPGEDPTTRAAFLAAATRDWLVGVLLVRRGAHAVAVVDGRRVVVSKVDTRYVQGRTAAGGWSQQRFARRRDNQTRESAAAAAEHAVRVLGGASPRPVGLVLGGDRAMCEAVLADRRLAWLERLPRAPFLDVPEPRRQTLLAAAQRYRMVHIRLVDRSDV